jgi:L-alanine-DL-glutamate epimerase-like enolase superfamily enzyme
MGLRANSAGTGGIAVKVTCRTLALRLETPFTIFRGTTAEQVICIAEIEHDGVTGYGEASPSAYYGDSVEEASRAIRGAEDLIGNDPLALESVSRSLARAFPGTPSGRAAVEMALYDIAGKIAGLPLFRMLGLSGMKPPLTSYTVGVEDVELVRANLEHIKSFPLLKVKLGFGREEDLLDLLKAETRAVIRADANEGWSVETAVEKMNRYQERYSIEFFEQPLPKSDTEGYRRLKAETGSTVIVDESIVKSKDVFAWAALADGVNIKVMKSGGIRAALAMISAARAAGLRVMLGCMIESSLGISAAAHIAPLVDYCDLDGNLLIANDPFEGVRGAGGILDLGALPGLGVCPRA